ncbi:hypothetical protein LUZ60_013527 [Juncus effusus]|nr:hypothetical protein LUZ60_013527 [Juncus effusus]
MTTTFTSTAIKQVTKSTFTPSLLHELKSQIESCDFISLASLKTASFSAASPWRRRLFPFDTAETAYLKARLAAESFEMMNFSVCPFRVEGSKVVAYPYNFHLFPRDVLNMNMPSYSFSCQPSYLESLAREGFDFNLCIYEGISYLSRVQESLARERNPTPVIHTRNSNPNSNVADSLFKERIKSRVEHWRKICKKSNQSHGEQELVSSLRKLILGTETYGTRPCINIDVCTDRQLELVLETINNINNISDDLVLLVVPDKSGTASRSVRVVLASSHEDKNLLLSEINRVDEEQNVKIRGFRGVIDLLSMSHKPIVAYNCLYDFTFIHSKFIGPLPQSMHEFMCSLKMVFPNIVDLGHLMKETGPLRNAKNVSSALSCLNAQSFVPIHLEVPFQAENNAEKNNQGRNVLKITSLFAKLSKLLKCNLIEEHSNIFHPVPHTDLDALSDQEQNVNKLDPDNLIFILGTNCISVSDMRERLKGNHSIFSEDFDLRILDRNCAVLVFWRQGAAIELFEEMKGNNSSLVINLCDGVKIANFEAYKRVCKLGFWDDDLANSLENVVLSETDCSVGKSVEEVDLNEVDLDSEYMLDPNEYLKG